VKEIFIVCSINVIENLIRVSFIANVFFSLLLLKLSSFYHTVTVVTIALVHLVYKYKFYRCWP